MIHGVVFEVQPQPQKAYHLIGKVKGKRGRCGAFYTIYEEDLPRYERYTLNPKAELEMKQCIYVHITIKEI